MKYLVPVVLLFMTLAFWLAVDQNANLGKTPNDEEIIHTQERNKVTGELLNVEIIRCRICGQVISYIQANLRGKVVYGYLYRHRCGKYGNNPLAKYSPLGLAPESFDLEEWLNRWQKRLRLRR